MVYMLGMLCPPLEAQMRNVHEAVAEGPEFTLHLLSVTTQSTCIAELSVKRS